jgi:hypothetical protein
MPRKIILFLSLFITFCGPGKSPESDPKIPVSGLKIAGLLPQPKVLDANKLKSFVGTLGFMGGAFKPLSSATKDPTIGAQIIYAKAIADFSEVPREQGADALGTILDDSVKACGQVSCSTILGFEKGQIQQFFNDLLMIAGGQPKSKIRDSLVASLTPASAFKNPTSPLDFVATIFHRRPQDLPPPMPPPKDIMSAKDLEAALGKGVISAIQNYTLGGYYLSRRVETMSPTQAAKDGISPTTYELWKKRTEAINRSLKSVRPITQNVYRGLNMVPMATLARWVQKWREGSPMHLGPGDQPALTSATWDLEVAKNFLVIGAYSSPFGERDFSVVFEIVDHGGVGIQAVSRMPREHEVLIPAFRQFVIEDMAPLTEFKRGVYIKLRGQPETESGSRGQEKTAA